MIASSFRRQRRYVTYIIVSLLLSAVLPSPSAAAASAALVDNVRISGAAGATKVRLSEAVTISEKYGPNGLFEVVGGAQEAFVGFALVRVTPEKGPVGVFAGLLPSTAGGVPYITTPGEGATLQPGEYDLVLMTSDAADISINLPGLPDGTVTLAPEDEINYYSTLLTERSVSPTTYAAGDSFTLTHPAAITFGAHWVYSQTHVAGQYSICRGASGIPPAFAYSHVCPLGERTDTFRTDTVTNGTFRGMVVSLRSGNNLDGAQGIGGVSAVVHPYVSAGAVGVWLSLPDAD